ncbi:MAG: hypothetical protein KAG06_06925, partial [Methylococcales bacterium]|nr:hypothetical protein [Methylococcales bacterium]
NSHIIPTTARDRKTFLRATCIDKFDYAVINHGGIILNANGALNTDWFQEIEPKIRPLLPVLTGLQQQVQLFSDLQNLSLNIRLIDDYGITFYLSIKHQQGQAETLHYVNNSVIQPYLELHELDFYCHMNDNNLSVLPDVINKAPAVAYVQKQLDKHYKDYLSFGIGDSLTDMAYMQLCDYFITPQNSQIMQHF